MEFLVLVLLLGIGPLALRFGVDSRVDEPHGWWPGESARQAAGRLARGRREAPAHPALSARTEEPVATSLAAP
jgi:hypothetical protein